MRITGGEYGGRILEAPKGRDIRPTSDKVRLAIFNMLNGRGLVEGANVIDAFCGTGALGIEALSWGAARCQFVDKSRDSLDLAKRNCATLKIDAADFLLKDAGKIGPKPEEFPAATLVFLDPPYRQNLVVQSLESLRQNGWLSQTEHTILCETEVQADPSVLTQAGYDIAAIKDYGDTRVVLAQK